MDFVIRSGNYRILRIVATSIAIVTAMGLVTAGENAFAADETEVVRVTEKLQIPGAVLKPGDYTLSVEDRMQDRAIVRITSADRDKHYLILAIPSTNLASGAKDGLVFFRSEKEDKQALKEWMCPGCSTGLEFVYPKAEAAKLTDESAESVLAIDPE